MTRLGFLVVVAIIAAACGSGGSTPSSGKPDAAPTGALSSAAAPSGGGPSAPTAVSEQPIVNHGPAGWERGPYELTGGTYRLDWETDGSCSALYFGLVGISNGYRESPPTAGDVALKDMVRGSRTISAVPPGSYYFNVSNVACKKYSATLTRVP